MQSSTNSVKHQLLDIFSKAGGNFVSGQSLADQIGCSRTAVWKHIESLRHEGFELEAVRNKGYRITSKPDKVTENEVLIGLQTDWLGKRIVYKETVASTQKEAHQIAEEAAEGTVVIAEEQQSGRGRLERSFHSPPGTGIWMSLILKPDLPPFKAPQFTLIAAVAVAEAIQSVTGTAPEIKWPNDLLMNGKKITGILTELQADADRIRSIIIGIGINVNQSSFPEELANIATSIAMETGRPVSRAALVQEIFRNMEALYNEYIEHGFAPIKPRWERYAVSIGRRLIARTPSGTIRGQALGITEDGVLKLEGEDGTVHDIYSADIEIDR